MRYKEVCYVAYLASYFDLHFISWLVSRTRMDKGVERYQNVAQNTFLSVSSRFQGLECIGI